MGKILFVGVARRDFINVVIVRFFFFLLFLTRLMDLAFISSRAKSSRVRTLRSSFGAARKQRRRGTSDLDERSRVVVSLFFSLRVAFFSSVSNPSSSVSRRHN